MAFRYDRIVPVEISLRVPNHKKSRQRLCVRFFFASELFMKKGILRTCSLFALTVLCLNTGLSPLKAQQPQQTREGITTTFAPVVEKVAPSVVTVFTTQTVSRGQTAFSFSDDALRQFFGGRAPQGQGKQTLQGLGSGVIVSPDGYILTANHVVSGADAIMIGLGNDLRRFKPKKIGTDPGTDVALLKIDENNLPSVNFADSDKARAGDIVLAIGNPFGLRQTVTMGIISAVGRGGMGIVDYENFIQTDAAINMGNSGGALVDTGGRLLGINSAIFTRSGGNQGIGFAIPANLAREVMQSLRDKGRVVRGYIGTSVQTLTPEIADAMKLKGPQTGALVGEVEPNAPAAKAGIKTGDVITAVNGKKVNDPRELRLMVGSMAPGTRAHIEINREGQTKTVDVQLGEMPPGAAEEGTATSSEEPTQPEKTTVFGGVAVADITNDIRTALNLPKDVQGAVIADIDAESPAAKSGLREGDVIQEVNKQSVKSAKDLVAISKKLKPNEKILMRVYSQGGSGYVALEPK
jgi:serine protease Do